MHMVIRAIVYGKNEEEALKRAEIVFGRLVEDGSFDYYTLFNDNRATMSGKARWGNLPPVALAKSKEGRKLISDAMKATKDEFYDNVRKLRNALRDFTTEELFKMRYGFEDKYDEYGFDFRYVCNCIGSYSGESVWLYDNDGSGIRDEGHLKDVLTKWNEGKKVYVVPADVHY